MASKRIFIMKNGTVIDDDKIMDAYNITTGKKLNRFSRYDDQEIFRKYLDYLYTVSISYELEPCDETVNKLALNGNRGYAMIMHRDLHGGSLKEAKEYIDKLIESNKDSN